MDILNNICELLKEKNKKQKDLTDALGLTKNSFTGWKSGKSTSYMKYLPQIAEFLGVSVDFLCGKSEKETKSSKTPEADTIEKQIEQENRTLAFALYGTSDIDEEVLNDVRKYAIIARRMREEKKKEGQ